MSGTSIDGVDAALVEFDADQRIHLLKVFARPYPEEVRRRLLAVSTQASPLTLRELARLDAEVGDAFAATAVALLHNSTMAPGKIRAIGAHGQTIFHDPGTIGNSLQIGDPNRIAIQTGITTVADFRRADIAAGGQGAPLVPAFHHAAFARTDEFLCIVNIGGIANVTLLPGRAKAAVRGFDTGPGNGLMDEWIMRCRNLSYDAGGQWAGGGHVNSKLLAAMLDDPWFSHPPPKSTGRDTLNLRWVESRFPALGELPPADVQRTFCEVTALSITAAAQAAEKLVVCGGGACNDLLMKRLQDNFHGVVTTTAEYDLDPQWVEAAAFAWLAAQRLRQLPGNLPAVTGARRPVVLGAIYAA